VAQVYVSLSLTIESMYKDENPDAIPGTLGQDTTGGDYRLVSHVP
jgi:hypothetical protein